MTSPSAPAQDRPARPSKRQDIINVFGEMVGRRGFGEANLRDVAAELQISKGTILHHFRSKDALLEEVMLGYLERREGELRHILAASDDPVQQIRDVILMLITSLRDDGATLAWIREAGRLDDTEANVVNRRREAYTRDVERIIERGMAHGAFRPGDARIASLQVIGMCCWAWTWFPTHTALSAEQVAGDFADRILGGMAA